jgi:hypothetical protein
VELYLHSPNVFMEWCLVKVRDFTFFYYSGSEVTFVVTKLNHVRIAEERDHWEEQEGDGR